MQIAPEDAVVFVQSILDQFNDPAQTAFDAKTMLFKAISAVDESIKSREAYYNAYNQAILRQARR